MDHDQETRIRHRAYEIWEEEGRPEGREHEHWHRATRETNARSAAQAGPTKAKAPDTAKPLPAEAGEPAAASRAAPRRRSKPGEPAVNGAADPSKSEAAKPGRRTRRPAEAAS